MAADSPFGHIQHAKKRAFLSAYAELGMVRRAAHAAKVDRGSHLIWKRDDPEYAEAFKLAGELAKDALEDAAVQRARYGVQEPVFHRGKVCGYITRFSDVLLIFTLKALDPEKYRERWDGHVSGDVGITKRLIGVPLEEV